MSDEIPEAREALQKDCARISEECGIPPSMAPAPGEIARIIARAVAAEAEAHKARSVCEEIENYAMTANQSILTDKEPIRQEIFYELRDIARKGCTKGFASGTYCELQDTKEELTAAIARAEAAERERDDWKNKWEHLSDDVLKDFELSGFLVESESGEGFFDFLTRTRKERAELRREVEALQRQLFDANIAELKASAKENEADKARLDWLNSVAGMDWFTCCDYGDATREAIDAARANPPSAAPSQSQPPPA